MVRRSVPCEGRMPNRTTFKGSGNISTWKRRVWRDEVRTDGSSDVIPGGCPRCGGRSPGHQVNQVMQCARPGIGSQPSVAGRAAAAVAELGKEGTEGKAPRVDGARCALRMRRGNATVSARQNMRFADVLQTRSRENARSRVPRTASRPIRGWYVGIIIIIFGLVPAAPMRTSPPG